MVLTNFEFWAADGSSSMPSSAASVDFQTSRHLNPFDPHAVPHMTNSNMTHLSSNGYYGFSYINASHEMEQNNNNNNNNNHDIINNNNISSIHSNNNNNITTTHNFMANDVNGMNNTTIPQLQQQKQQLQQPSHVYANFVQQSTAETPPAGNTAVRCKKRFFVVSDDDVDANIKCAADGDVFHNSSNVPAAKRCRFDDDFAAEYCNDFFSLPSTQIATQSCLMDSEEALPPLHNLQQQQQHHLLNHHQQQQLHANQHHQTVNVDEPMFENNNNNNNICFNNNNNNNNIEKYEQSILHLQQQQQQPPTSIQQQQEQQQLLYQQQQQQQHQHQQSYHQQQHYQGHLHRSNRDVSRCMLSHMI